MKFIALSKYHNPSGQIPLFLELRNLNSITSKDIISYLHGAYKGNTRLGLDRFKAFVSSGAFLLILDGFDEVDPDHRIQIEDQIVRLSQDYPNAAIIVSGRPDEKFNPWSKYTHWALCPMALSQVESLINKLDYDKKVKAKFIRRLKSDLFNSHESFLSTPLLATLMLLTFEQYADIPDKVHIFYDNAFETLFNKHDALKEQYTRKTRSGLTIDVFRKVFAAFSAISYSDAAYTFNAEQLHNSVGKAIQYFQAPCKAPEFVSDLMEAVCLLQLEGFEYSFVHRSFQEYFCALFLANADSVTRSKFMDESWARVRDNVLPMLFDMAQEAIEDEWVVPAIDRILKSINARGGKPIDGVIAEIASVGAGFDNDMLTVWFYGPGEFGQTIAVLKRLYPAHFVSSGSLQMEDIDSRFADLFPSVVKEKENVDPRFKRRRRPDKAPSYHVDYEVNITRDDDEWLRATGVFDRGKGNLRALKAIRDDVVGRSKQRMTFLDGLFDSKSGGD